MRSAVAQVRVDLLADPADFRAAVHDATFWGLRAEPKELPVTWLYDQTGSRLFDEITRLPEYYPTRAERDLLRAHADEIAATSGARTLVELGSGTSEKTRLLLDALVRAGALERFVPFDVSREVLEASARAIAAEYPGLRVHAIAGDFERHLDALPPGERRTVAFLGSTIGNLLPDRRRAFLARLAGALAPGDGFLLGVDLVKDPRTIERAYNDAAGVTERFVRNALDVVDRELRADFAQGRFAFEARWDAERELVDIGFRARVAHTVRVRELEIEVPFAAGEQLRVEVSCKFRPERVDAELAAAGLRSRAWWIGPDGAFGLVYATPV